jgi:hypothetical protein
MSSQSYAVGVDERKKNNWIDNTDFALEYLQTAHLLERTKA